MRNRMATALAVALLGVGLAFTPTSTQAACKCAKKVAACKKAARIAANCKAETTRSAKKTCKQNLKAAQQADCHNCTKPCSSPSGAFVE